MRQQQVGLKEGFKWNELLHRKPGGRHFTATASPAAMFVQFHS